MKSIQIFRTAKSTSERLTPLPAQTVVPWAAATSAQSVVVDASVIYQEFIGIGGAFTESAATTLQKMSPAKQEEILQAYFNPESGLGYTLGRIHLNSCDFSLGNWACNAEAGDTGLKAFSIAHYHEAIIPMVKRAFEISGKPLTLFVSPWSPPGWMKDTGIMNRGGKLLAEYRAAWAMNYVRFIQELGKIGIPIWGLSVQNEPAATQSWDSCIYTAEEEKDFVRDHLGPALHANGLAHIKVIIWDHNRDCMVERAKVAYDDPEAARYIWGVGFHWYMSPSFENVQRVHDLRPDKHLIFTEGCQEGGPHTGEWELGERYGESIIQDLNHWTEAWTDWNLILDTTGGPNHVGNLCSAPILADTESDELTYNSSYYYFGHFSKFIKPGAKRILCAPSDDRLECTAFANPEGTIAMVVMNRTEEAIVFDLKYAGKSVAIESLRRSICTCVLTDER